MNPPQGAEILQLVSSMFEGEGEWLTPAGSAALSTNPHSTMAIDRYGLCRSISGDRWLQLLMGSHMPYDQYGAPYPSEHQDDSVAAGLGKHFGPLLDSCLDGGNSLRYRGQRTFARSGRGLVSHGHFFQHEEE